MERIQKMLTGFFETKSDERTLCLVLWDKVGYIANFEEEIATGMLRHIYTVQEIYGHADEV